MPPPPVYSYDATAIGEPGDSEACRTILVLGDSLMVETAPELPNAYEELGYCATVINGGVNGASTMSTYLEGGREVATVDHLATLVDAHHPDAVVFSFVGNVSWAQMPAAAAAYLGLVDQALASGLQVFATTPPVSAFLCDPHAAWSLGHQAFRDWVMSDLPSLRGGEYATVRWSEVLSPGGSWPNYGGSLRFPDGSVHPVRFQDCVHLSGTRGIAIAAHEVVAATQVLWAG